MLKGDLTSTPLAPLLLDLADDAATGCLVITDSTDDEALVYFKSGLIYSVSVPGSRPQLGAKLVSSGALAPEALSEALEAQRTELQGWRLGELLVHLGYVDQPVVEAFVAEQVSEALWDLLRWSDGRWKFRKNVKAREDVGPPMAIVDLLETLRERGYVWETISAVVHGPGAVPRLSTRGDTSSETTLDNDAWSMLCKIDGERSVAELAADCGYTLFEAGHVIVSLVQAGLVDIDEEIDVEGSALYGATTLSSAFSGDLDDADFTAAETDDEDALTKLARLVNEVAGTGEATDDGTAATVAAEAAPAPPAQRRDRDRELDGAMTVSVNRHSGESFAASIARVSGALSEVLGEVPPPDIDPEELAARRRRAAPSTDDPEWQRRKRLRTAAAAELASAQALIETLRPDRDTAVPTPEYTGDVPKVLSRATERERAVARDAEEAAREAAEQFARAAAEEAERVAGEQEATRIAAEQAAAEQAARLAAESAAEQAAEAAQLAADQAAAEEAARLDAEAESAAAEAARAQAERDAAEESAWAEYWQREEAERAAAAEAVRVAAELEAERLAAEEAERQAAAEAERQAAEEAERVAAAEAERLAQAQAEFDRIAAEEAARQAEADRIAAEEAERQAQAEAERAAAEAKAEAAARRKAEKAAAAEAAKRDEEAAAASALLAEFAASSAAEESGAAEDEGQEPEYDLAPEELAEAEVREPVSVGGGWSDADTDTASLLRELSSLGGDDDDRDAASGPAIPARPRPTAPDKKVKKKIGLFGL